MSASEVEAFLEVPRTGILSTLDRSGAPHSAGMWFASVGRTLQMWTYAKSQKAINLRRDPRCAFLVEDGVAYNELRGVLVKGKADLLEDPEQVAAIGLLLYDRYTLPTTGIPAADGPIVEIERQARKRIGVVLALDDVASWDHSRLAAGTAH